MAKQHSKQRSRSSTRKDDEHRAHDRRDRKRDRALERSLRSLERRLETAAAEHRVLRKRVKRLSEHLAALPPPRPGRGPGGTPWGKGAPPWARGSGPTVSLEIPLETDDPTAPLWATVSARIPEEITAVGDDGRVIRYRYSAVGSTAQAPRYRRLEEPDPSAPERFPR